jgi:fumarylacetoacetase
MIPRPDSTHDPALRAWLDAANAEGTDFPIQNLPLGVIERERGEGRVAVAIGDRALDLRATADAGHLAGLPPALLAACRAPRLNDLMALGPSAWSALRRAASDLLRVDGPGPRLQQALLPKQAEVRMGLPAEIGDYTDFYASVHHATNVGRMFRPDQPLLPNYKWVPIGYHGRASSVVVSGTPVRRPHGQVKDEAADAPVFDPSRRLDYEVELGCYVGPGNPLGAPVPIGEASGHLFGFCLLNDWSARDVQAWEYQPLGPFLAKNFASTVSPWIVTADALAPFRGPLSPRAAGDPEPLPYLSDPDDAALGGVGVVLEAMIQTEAMRGGGYPPYRLSRSDARDLFWTPAQLLAHHASNGCNLRPGDLLGSGTVSGPEELARGCLLELTWRGSRPVTLPGGEVRRFLEDGDEVILRGTCRRDGWASIGFGECRGRVIP